MKFRYRYNIYISINNVDIIKTFDNSNFSILLEGIINANVYTNGHNILTGANCINTSKLL
ncbi:MAG: hypothetical protein H5T96_01350 [Tissierellales bacterium]|nr:hypothetical protein [Tissierellales bacterium]